MKFTHYQDCSECGSLVMLNEQGLCAACWKDLTPEQRASLLGIEVPIKEIVEHRTEVYRINPPNRLSQVIGWLWRIGVTVVLTWLLLK